MTGVAYGCIIVGIVFAAVWYLILIEESSRPWGWPFARPQLPRSRRPWSGNFWLDAERARRETATPDAIARARAEWVNPEHLDDEVWTGDAMLDQNDPFLGPNDRQDPCGRCGYPRWAHAAPPIYFDGRCIVPGRHPCDGVGYQPSRPRLRTR